MSYGSSSGGSVVTVEPHYKHSDFLKEPNIKVLSLSLLQTYCPGTEGIEFGEEAPKSCYYQGGIKEVGEVLLPPPHTHGRLQERRGREGDQRRGKERGGEEGEEWGVAGEVWGQNRMMHRAVDGDDDELFGAWRKPRAGRKQGGAGAAAVEGEQDQLQLWKQMSGSLAPVPLSRAADLAGKAGREPSTDTAAVAAAAGKREGAHDSKQRVAEASGLGSSIILTNTSGETWLHEMEKRKFDHSLAGFSTRAAAARAAKVAGEASTRQGGDAGADDGGCAPGQGIAASARIPSGKPNDKLRKSLSKSMKEMLGGAAGAQGPREGSKRMQSLGSSPVVGTGACSQGGVEGAAEASAAAAGVGLRAFPGSSSVGSTGRHYHSGPVLFPRAKSNPGTVGSDAVTPPDVSPLSDLYPDASPLTVGQGSPFVFNFPNPTSPLNFQMPHGGAASSVHRTISDADWTGAGGQEVGGSKGGVTGQGWRSFTEGGNGQGGAVVGGNRSPFGTVEERKLKLKMNLSSMEALQQTTGYIPRQEVEGDWLGTSMQKSAAGAAGRGVPFVGPEGRDLYGDNEDNLYDARYEFPAPPVFDEIMDEEETDLYSPPEKPSILRSISGEFSGTASSRLAGGQRAAWGDESAVGGAMGVEEWGEREERDEEEEEENADEEEEDAEEEAGLGEEAAAPPPMLSAISKHDPNSLSIRTYQDKDGIEWHKRGPLTEGAASLFETEPAEIPELVDRFGFIVEEGEEGAAAAAAAAKHREEKMMYIREEREVRKWRAMIGLGPLDWNLYFTKHPREVKKRIRRGVPDSLRGIVWQLISGSRELLLTNEGIYEHLVLYEASNSEMDIIRDINRTFPNHVFFQQKHGPGQRSLYNVLKAYSVYDKKVGYVQGMGFICGLLLLYMSEEDVFWLMVAIMKGAVHSPLEGLFLVGLPLVQQYLFQFEALLRDFMPKLAAHLESEGINTSMYASQWFITIFAYNFPFATTVRIWDIFLFEGMKTIFRVGLALLKLRHDELLEMPFEELVPALRTFPDELLEADSLLNVAFSFKLTNRLHELKVEYLAQANVGLEAPLPPTIDEDKEMDSAELERQAKQKGGKSRFRQRIKAAFLRQPLGS